MAEIELSQTNELLEEAKFLHQIGEYSEAELEETSLLYELTANKLFEAAAERYTALRSLLDYTN